MHSRLVIRLLIRLLIRQLVWLVRRFHIIEEVVTILRVVAARTLAFVPLARLLTLA